MKVIKVYPRQTIFDVALQYYGDVQGVLLLIEDNNIALDEPLETGQLLFIRQQVINRAIVNKLSNHIPVSNG